MIRHGIERHTPIAPCEDCGETSGRCPCCGSISYHGRCTCMGEGPPYAPGYYPPNKRQSCGWCFLCATEGCDGAADLVAEALLPLRR